MSSSAFDEAWSKASSDIDGHFGSLWLYTPMMVSPTGGRPVLDTSRPVAIITGALDEKRAYSYPEARHKAERTVSEQATHLSTIDIAINALPYAPQKFDRLQACDPNGNVIGATFEVDSPDSDEIARILLRVIKKKSGT